MARKGYIGIEGDVAKQIKNLYIGIDDKARKVVKIYLGVGDIAQLIFDGLQCLNHSFTKVIQEIVATCETPKQVVKQCPNCGLEDTFEEGSPLGHDKNVTITSTPATCTSKGLTDGKACSRCGKITVAQKVIDINPNNHTGISIKGGTENVHTKYSCCGKTISSTHSYTESTVQATCIATGTKTYSCSCGYSYQTIIPVNPSAHTSFPWCSRCKKIYKEEWGWGGFFNSSNVNLLAWHEFTPVVDKALGVNGYQNNSSHIVYKLLNDWSVYGEAAPLSSIHSLFIQPGITTIESYAFRYIHTVPNLALKKIYIPNTVTSLKAYAFLDCGNYEIHYQGRVEDWNKVTKASGWNASGAKIYDYRGTLLS